MFDSERPTKGLIITTIIVNLVVNLGQFFGNKNTPSMMATKIIKKYFMSVYWWLC